MNDDRIWNLMAKKLSGEASAGELRELEFSLRQDPDLHYSLEAMQDMWKNPSHTEPEQAEIAYQNHLERMRSLGIHTSGQNQDFPGENISKKHRLAKWKIATLSVSGFLVLIFCFYFFEPRNPVPLTQKPVWEVVTRIGTKTNLLLPDGSTVWLNAGSRLTYDSLYGNTVREVTLSGEAYFDVIKNPKKPFIIHTGNVNIKVLGTAFNVKSYPGEKTIEASLIRGSLEVTFANEPAKKIFLKPNEKLVIKKDLLSQPQQSKTSITYDPSQATVINHLTLAKSDSTIVETAWVRNKLAFQDESFHDLAIKMERWYGVNILFDHSSVDTVHFTGSFDSENIQQALNALRLSAQFNYSIHNNDIQITTK